MCLRKMHTRPKVAENDIEVYKVLDDRGKSPYMEYSYHHGLNAPATHQTGDGDGEEIGSGYLHAYRVKGIAEFEASRLDDALDRFHRRVRAFPRPNTRLLVLKMYIPAGVPYYEGTYGDICAEALYWPEEDKVMTV